MSQQKIPSGKLQWFCHATMFLAVLFTASGVNARIKDFGLLEYVHTSRDLPRSETTPWELVCTMPYNCQFQPWIELESVAGKVIGMESSNPHVDHTVKQQNYTTKAGIQTYEAPSWISGEGVVYYIPAGVTVRAVKYHETGYDTKLAGSFVCNDEDFNVLWKKAQRTVYLCMRDYLMACPDRERDVFWGDGTTVMNTALWAFDTAAYAACKDLVIKPLPAGFYPGQQIQFVGHYGVWGYYMHTNDLQSISAVYDQSKKLLMTDYTMGNASQWFDWGSNSTDVAVIENCYMYLDLVALKKMALLTGHAVDTPAIITKLAGIKSTFDSKYWKPAGYYMSSNVTTPDDRANAMAVIAGFADSSKWNAIYTNVLTKYYKASNFFDRWVFEALCIMGKQEYALLRMYTRFKTMIPAPFTTLWETYDHSWPRSTNVYDDMRNFNSSPTGTYANEGEGFNHGWNPPVITLTHDIAGIAPESPGWSVYHVLPKEAFLTSIKAVVQTIKGPVTVDMKKSATEYSLSLISPANTKAIVGIPKGSFTTLSSIKVNGTTVWNGTYSGGVTGISLNGDDSRYVKFNADPGTWTFVGLGSLPMTSPKPLPPPPPDDSVLDKKGWVATASVRDTTFVMSDWFVPVKISAARAIDDDHWTGWRDRTKFQNPAQWFKVDMRTLQTFDKIILENSWALWDYPRGYSVSVSNDGTNWGTPVATGAGKVCTTVITFPVQTARYIRINQTATSTVFYWSIYKLDVCKTRPVSIGTHDASRKSTTTMARNSAVFRTTGDRFVLPAGCAGKAVSVEVFNPGGRLIARTVVKGSTVDLSNFVRTKAGVYIVRVIPQTESGI